MRTNYLEPWLEHVISLDGLSAFHFAVVCHQNGDLGVEFLDGINQMSHTLVPHIRLYVKNVQLLQQQKFIENLSKLNVAN